MKKQEEGDSIPSGHSVESKKHGNNLEKKVVFEMKGEYVNG